MEVYINGNRADVDDNIEIVRQVMDIFDISIRAVDFSKNIKLPKTARNKEIFEGLGFSDSEFPYKRVYADIYESGLLVMRNATVKVSNVTLTHYEINCFSSSKDLWLKVENDTLGDLDLSDTTHTKTATYIKNQWETGLTPSTSVAYFLADYGGKLPSDNKVYGDYLIPSYRLPYLIDKINEKYDCEIILPESMQDDFITFSDANEIESTNDRVVWEEERGYFGSVNDIIYQVEEDGIYFFQVNCSFYAFAGIKVYLGDFFKEQMPTFVGFGSGTLNFVSPELYLKKNQQFRITSESRGVRIKGTFKVIQKARDISGNKSFQNFKISDFLKEIIYQTASIPIRSEKEYHFITLPEIIANDPEDWSDYFDSIEKETYVIGKYSQKNWLRYKYSIDEDFSKDGYIPVENYNLSVSTDIIKSNFYNTPSESIKFTIGDSDITTQQFHLWQRTIEQKTGGVFEERYQPQSGRMYLITGERITTLNTFIIEVGTSSLASTNNVIVGRNEKFNFQKIINSQYKYHRMFLKHTKVINVVMKIPLITFVNFDFKRCIYIKQLGGYFYINRMTHKHQELTKLELFKVN